MGDGIAATMLWGVDRALAETMLFAAVLFAIGGIDDLLVDLLYLHHRRPADLLADLPRVSPPLRFAIFVPAWDEHRVIAAMLRTLLSRYDHADYRVFVGCYPNDPATIAAVREVADPRVRLVVGERDGPTTKADCLNTLWHAMRRADADDGRATNAVVLHDAEDVVHSAELAVFDHHLRRHALVQLPVVPLIDRAARFVSGHYGDEFAESHGKGLVVRAGIGAGLPLAGVGCAIRVAALEQLAGTEGPFATASLTEDYETGLRVAGLGLPVAFVRVREWRGGPLVATRAYFPDTVHHAVVQKARWMAGIAFAGWDRIGWGGFRPVELWMRARDRRAPLAVLALLLAYAALVGWGVSLAGHALTDGAAPDFGSGLEALLTFNAVLLAWRLIARSAATAADHGWREGLWAIPRVFVANYIAILAARRAVTLYVRSLGGRAMRWDKTAHRFPEASEA